MCFYVDLCVCACVFYLEIPLAATCSVSVPELYSLFKTNLIKRK
jgi:hypothetical protein